MTGLNLSKGMRTEDETMATERMDEELIPHDSFHAEHPETIVLIAGAGTDGSSSTAFFRPVISRLTGFHVLVPFLPTSYSLPDLCTKLAQLIKACGRTASGSGKAHIIAFSLGTHATIYLAKEHPEVIESIFVTGFNRLDRSKFWTPAAPYVWWSLESIGRALQLSKSGGSEASIDEEGKSGGKEVDDKAGNQGLTLSKCKETLAILASWDELPKLQARTLVVVATKGHFGLPTGDSIASARDLYHATKSQNSRSRLMEAKSGRHAWCVEQPEEFAKCVRDWVEGKDKLPDFLTPLADKS